MKLLNIILFLILISIYLSIIYYNYFFYLYCQKAKNFTFIEDFLGVNKEFEKLCVEFDIELTNNPIMRTSLSKIHFMAYNSNTSVYSLKEIQSKLYTYEYSHLRLSIFLIKSIYFFVYMLIIYYMIYLIPNFVINLILYLTQKIFLFLFIILMIEGFLLIFLTINFSLISFITRKNIDYIFKENVITQFVLKAILYIYDFIFAYL